MYNLKRFVKEQMTKNGYITPPDGFEVRISCGLEMRQILCGELITLYATIGEKNFCFAISPKGVQCMEIPNGVWHYPSINTDGAENTLVNHLKRLLADYEEDTNGHEQEASGNAIHVR